MKQQKPDSNNNGYFQKIFKTIPFLGIVLFFGACTNDIEEVNELLNPLDIPELEAHEIQITRTDSGKILFIAKAPYVIRYNNNLRNYAEFPDGLQVFSFENYPDTSSKMKAGYAKYYTEKNLWEARSGVEAENENGEKLVTEQLFWDQEKGIIYSSSYTTIYTADGVFHGKKGFESDDSFKKWKLINTEGEMNVKDD